ncbi:hypothetical protein CGZ93_17740 [Enemella dayhoffiae]|uniref:Uncharacterized protein n=2 Tax=Enemella dayhoffiae TaxID=2016507 RepID=A0A255GQD7_9ACTN|nr:hypothetical protein CGZ93_17740 [Enemella dayhoffiae]
MAAFRWGMKLDNVTGILTILAIVIGLCFSMAVTIWNKSIDARSTAGLATDGYALTVLDNTRTHLVFTVMYGVTLAAVTVLYQIFAGVLSVFWGKVASAVIVGGSIYLLALVLQALGYFQRVFHVLKP